MPPPTVEQLQQRLAWREKQRAYAWAQFYAVRNEQLHDDHQQYDTFNRVADDRAVPEHIKAELKAMATALKKKWECPVCMDMIDDGDLVITNCGHFYCKACLEAWKKTEKDRGEEKWKCGCCNRKHNFKDE